MKRAVSVSLGSTKRDATLEITLLGERIHLERIGVNGDLHRASELFRGLDGEVDALGLGGMDLGMWVDDRFYPLYGAQRLADGARHTPVVDGAGLKHTLEGQIGRFLESRIGEYLDEFGRRALVTVSVDRWGMALAFDDLGYECIFGDFMFALGLPIRLRKLQTVRRISRIILPLGGRLPIQWLYPMGAKQETISPRWTAEYKWATVIAGDRNYIVRHMPTRLTGKVVVTNTTTEDDRELFRNAGVRFLVTTTPVYQGRSVGTNLLEAAFIAASGQKRELSVDELDILLERSQIQPQLQEFT